jgi:hypothetical protein
MFSARERRAERDSPCAQAAVGSRSQRAAARGHAPQFACSGVVALVALRRRVFASGALPAELASIPIAAAMARISI